MRYDSARSLKAELLGESFGDYIRAEHALPRAARAFASARTAAPPPVPMAIGITGSKSAYRLAVRLQELHAGIERAVEHVRARARGECDVRLVGTVRKQAPWNRRRNRPLRIGSSIGHVAITAGTLGCFVARRGGDAEELILSNNHVLANEDDAKIGDTILQHGKIDGGRSPREKVGELAGSARLKRRGNLVDAAVASIDDGMEYYYNWLETIGAISGVRTDPLDEGETVYKVGRTTEVTRGEVSAIEVDGLRVGYDRGDLLFENQIEIAPADDEPFSLGGDSGSLIVDSRQRAVALLFAGNDVDATYANPIEAVLDALKVDLVY